MRKREYAGVQGTVLEYSTQFSNPRILSHRKNVLANSFKCFFTITAVMVQCMYVCSPLRGKFKGTTTAAIFTRAAACILVYTRTVVRHRIFFVMFYIPQIGKFLPLKIFRQLLRQRKLNTRKFLMCAFNFATWPRGENYTCEHFLRKKKATGNFPIYGITHHCKNTWDTLTTF